MAAGRPLKKESQPDFFMAFRRTADAFGVMTKTTTISKMMMAGNERRVAFAPLYFGGELWWWSYAAM